MLRVANGDHAGSINRCGRPLSRALAEGFVAELFGASPPGWARFLRPAGADGPLPGRDAIELLAAQATLADCARALDCEPGALAIWEQGIALRTRRADPPDLVVWHERDVLAVRLDGGPQVLEIGYETDPTATPLSGIVERRPRAFPETGQRRYFEWRGYYGTGSRPEDGLARFFRKAGRSVARIVADGPGLLVGTVLRVCRVPDRLPELNGGRLFEVLRQRGAKRWTHRGGAVPRDLVADAAGGLAAANRCAIVLVHGGLSSSGAAFEKLDLGALGLGGSAPPPAPDCAIYAFEHDTCLGVRDNADELAQAAATVLQGCTRVLFLAHSRGGLVAREAVGLLPAKLPARAPLRGGGCRIVACGTPHLGTPILDDAAPLINALVVAAGFVDEVPRADPTLAALAYLAGGIGKLPQGLRDVATGSAVVTSLVRRKTAAGVTSSFAGKSGSALADTGYRPSLLELVRYGLVYRQAGRRISGPHDAVVPTDSAGAVGTRTDLADCSHWGYFARSETVRELKKWLVGCVTGP